MANQNLKVNKEKNIKGPFCVTNEKPTMLPLRTNWNGRILQLWPLISNIAMKDEGSQWYTVTCSNGVLDEITEYMTQIFNLLMVPHLAYNFSVLRLLLPLREFQSYG